MRPCNCHQPERFGWREAGEFLLSAGLCLAFLAFAVALPWLVAP